MKDLPDEFLRGIHLFNEARFFECHEAWETAWLKAEGVEREFLHAIIQAAAALHHFQRGNLKGFRSVGQRALGKLKGMPEQVMRVSTIKLRSSLESILTQPGNLFPRIELLTENP